MTFSFCRNVLWVRYDESARFASRPLSRWFLLLCEDNSSDTLSRWHVLSCDRSFVPFRMLVDSEGKTYVIANGIDYDDGIQQNHQYLHIISMKRVNTADNCNDIMEYVNNRKDRKIDIRSHFILFFLLPVCFLSVFCPTFPCLPFFQGYYSSSNSTAPLGRCNPGYYCPAQSTTPNEVPCPPRFYRPELGAGSVSDCSLCVAGGYCPEASIYPTICPKGYFCIGGVSIPEPCLPGSYGNTTGLRYLQSLINLFSRVNITA